MQKTNKHSSYCRCQITRKTLSQFDAMGPICLYMWDPLCLSQQLFGCNVPNSPIEGAPSLSQSFVTALSGPSGIHQGGCRSHPAPDRCCTEDETPDAYTCQTRLVRIHVTEENSSECCLKTGDFSVAYLK